MITHRGAETLHTKRLTLRQIRPEDSGAMFKNWAADPKVNRFLWWELHRDEAESRRIIEDWKTDRPDHYHWIIVCDGEGVGTIGCPNMVLDEINENCEIGYCLASRCWNKGLMSEALAAVIDFMIREVGVHRVYAKHDVLNVGSGRVMEKAGMKPEGIQREAVKRRDGTFGDLRVYAVLADEWKS